MTTRRETNGGCLSLQVLRHSRWTGAEGSYNRTTAPNWKNSPAHSLLMSRIAKRCQRQPTPSSVNRCGRSPSHQTKSMGRAKLGKGNTRACARSWIIKGIKIRTISLNFQPLMDHSRQRDWKKIAFIRVTHLLSRQSEISSKRAFGNERWLLLRDVGWRLKCPLVLHVMQEGGSLQQMQVLKQIECQDSLLTADKQRPRCYQIFEP